MENQKNGLIVLERATQNIIMQKAETGETIETIETGETGETGESDLKGEVRDNRLEADSPRQLARVATARAWCALGLGLGLGFQEQE